MQDNFPVPCLRTHCQGTVYIGTDGGQLLSLDSRNGQRVDVFPRGDALQREIKKATLQLVPEQARILRAVETVVQSDR